MRRLARIDILILCTLTPLWLACVFLHLDRQLAERPLAWVPLYVEPQAGPDAMPIVRGYWAETPAAEQTLTPGDVLLEVGGEPAAGRKHIGFWALVFEHATPDLTVPLTVQRAGARSETTLRLRAVSFPWRTVPLSVALGLSAVLAILRGRGSATARAYALGAIAYSIQWSFFFGGTSWQTHAGLGAFFLAGALYQPLTLRAALLFPEDVAVRSRLPHALCWIFSATALGLWAWLFGSPVSGAGGLRLLSLSYAVWIVAFLTILARNYRRSGARGRRQLKWVMYGFYVGLGPAVVGAVVFGARPDLRWVYELSLSFTVFIPICLYIAFIRYNLYDINRLITTTVVYTLLAPAFLGLLFSIGPQVAASIGGALGVQTTTALWLLAFVIAAPIPVLARLLRPQVERLLFREQFRLELGVRALRREVAEIESSAVLLESVAERLGGLLALESLAVYARAGEALALVHAQGTVIPLAFDADGTLSALLADARHPVDAARVQGWLRLPAVSVEERAAMASLDPEILIPIYHGSKLAAFVSLGEKQSGDLFTRTEIVLLESLGERVSEQMAHFDEERVLREQRELYERLASYVPGSIREEITRGAVLEPGEREISVLFVDVRGYTSFSQSREAAEVFAVVNAYTKAVSGFIREHGGSVVEFHGDGLLAVFGAPSALQDKERAALEAGRAAVKGVEGGSLGDLGDVSLSVGVGIATGTDFVGDIQSIDRKIWGVIGNTTNLASRLEGLTRTMDAAMVIDGTTYERAGEAAAGFEEHKGVRVKGRSEDFTVFALPRGALGPIEGGA